MLAYISGALVQKSPASCTIENNGMGFPLRISLHTYTAIQNLKETRLFTYLHVRNEGSNLAGFDWYGFATEEEKDIFEKLISISGIGANTARMMLSSLNPQEISQAILSGNVALIQSIKGIGPKTAQRVVLELRDKMGKAGSGEISSGSGSPSHNTIQQEALLALQSLGFARTQAESAIQKLSSRGVQATAVEDWIKQALKIL